MNSLYCLTKEPRESSHIKRLRLPLDSKSSFFMDITKKAYKLWRNILIVVTSSCHEILVPEQVTSILLIFDP